MKSEYLTPPGVPQVSYRLGHDYWSINPSFTIDAHSQKYIVEHTLHNVPVGNYACPRLKSIPDLSSCCGVGIRVVPDVHAGPIELPVPVPGHVRRYSDPWQFVE